MRDPCYAVPVTEPARKLLEAVLGLPEADRAAMAAELLASLDSPPDADWDVAWLAELDRRSATADGEAELAPEWSEVRTAILGELQRG